MEGLSQLGLNLGSILVYLVNFGLLVFVLSRVLFRPLMKLLDERRQLIRKSVDEAQELQAELEKRAAEAEAARREADAKIKEEMEKLRKFAEEKRAELTAEMEAARTEMLTKAQEDIERKQAALMKEAEHATVELIKKIVLHIVQNKVPEEVVEGSIKEAWKQFK